jgi:hypothetical protein
MWCHSFSIENVSELNRIHKHVQCVNQHSRACLLICSFSLGLLFVTSEKGKAILCHIQMLGNWFLFFLGFHIVTTGNLFLCLTMIQKRKNTKTPSHLINTQRLRAFVQISKHRVSKLFLLLNQFQNCKKNTNAN